MVIARCFASFLRAISESLSGPTPQRGAGDAGFDRRVRLACGVALACVGLIGCESGRSSATPSSTSTPESAQTAGDQRTSGPSQSEGTTGKLQRVELALNWFPEVEHAGYYTAAIEGYYAAEGLDVVIEPGGPAVPVIPRVAAGQVAFAVDNADKLLLLRAQEADAVAVMCPISESPRCLMFHAELGIESFSDLERINDLTLAINTGQPFAKFLQSQVNLDRATIVPYPGNVRQFLLEPRLGQQAYSFSEPWLVGREKQSVKLLMLSQLGFNAYTSLLITRGPLLTQQPELVRRMVRASVRGWQHYLKDPTSTHQRLLAENRELTAEMLDFGYRDIQSLTSAVKPEHLGHMSPDRWQTLFKQMVACGSLEPTVEYWKSFSVEFSLAAAAPGPELQPKTDPPTAPAAEPAAETNGQ